jgi:hypothetical protein
MEPQNSGLKTPLTMLKAGETAVIVPGEKGGDTAKATGSSGGSWTWV